MALWSTPLILLLPLWWGALYEPSMVLRNPGLFLTFFGLPLAGAALLYLWAAKTGRRRGEEGGDGEGR